MLRVEVFRSTLGGRDFGTLEFWRAFLEEGVQFDAAVPRVLDVIPLTCELSSQHLRRGDVKAGTTQPNCCVLVDAPFDDMSFVRIETK
jgi:hypothetical protein